MYIPILRVQSYAGTAKGFDRHHSMTDNLHSFYVNGPIFNLDGIKTNGKKQKRNGIWQLLRQIIPNFAVQKRSYRIPHEGVIKPDISSFLFYLLSVRMLVNK